ncbi:MAG: hypothetical protein ACRDL0_03495 [Thermoleophilaceae bacterium]
MSRNEQERLRDIKDAIAAIQDHLARTGERPNAEHDALLHDAPPAPTCSYGPTASPVP